MADTHPGDAERLHEYWVHGEGAAKIRWGEPGDFDRCVLHLGKYIRDPKGYCNLAHHAALGIYPATHAKMIKAGRSASMAHTEYRAKYNAGQLQAMVAKGQAMKNANGEPSYPIADEEDLHNAIHAVGRGGGSHDAIRAHIIKRAKALGMSSAIPDNWGASGSNDSDGDRSVASQVERRSTPAVLEVRMTDGGPGRIGGYAAVFGKLSRNLGGFVEKVNSTAFNQSRQLGWPAVKCRLNHDKNQLLGTTEARTLQLRTDNLGLDYEVEPPPSMRNVVEWVQRGDLRASSFAFNCPAGGDEWRTSDQGYPLRILHEVQLVDVAPVTEDAAYPDATAGLRSLAAAMDAPFEEVRALAAEDELRRFFVRTGRSPGKPEKPKVSGPMAMVELMRRRREFDDIDLT